MDAPAPMDAPALPGNAPPKNVLIVGVGGQGVIMVSKTLALLAQRAGHQVKQSEVHGMAKRGGGVFSHVRFGQEVFSPTIPAGEADIIVALEWAEGLRWIDFLRPGSGVFIADCQRIVPPFACRNRRRGAEAAYAPETPEDVMARVRDGFAIDAGAMAERLGEKRAANTVLLGVLSAALDFAAEDWRETIRAFVPPGTIEPNLRAFDAGRDWARRGERRVETPPAVSRARVAPHGDVVTTLEIRADWCKGCDICVKMCPERCLRLDARLVAELAAPDLCTGCRLCEWLCPDFAIRIDNAPAPAPAAAVEALS